MEISKLKLGHTFHGDTEELSGLAQSYLITKSETSFFAVELKIFGGNEVYEFPDLQSTFKYKRQHNLVYRFIEYTNIEAERKILVLHNVSFSDKVVGYQNFYGIGGNWKLFVNSKEDIVVQHILFPKTDTTLRLRNFPTDNEFYINLSFLIYTLTNYNLETENDIRDTFEKVRDCGKK